VSKARTPNFRDAPATLNKCERAGEDTAKSFGKPLLRATGDALGLVTYEKYYLTLGKERVGPKK
jgi:hypothetical protein